MPTITIHGLLLEAIEPYSEGHVLTADEAKALNSTFIDRVRNNFSRRVKTQLPECGWSEAPGLAQAIRSEFATYVATYRFDSAEQAILTREAQGLARALVMARLNAGGVRAELMTTEQIDALVMTCAQTPEVLAEAQRRIEALREAADTMLPQELQGQGGS